VKRALIVLVIAAVWPRSVDASGAHSLVRAALTYAPQNPRVGEMWRVSAVVQSADQALHPERRVHLVGTMMGHPMRPVEAALSPTGEAGTYSGALSFTMRGPWRIALEVDDLNQVQLATFDLEVVNADASSGGFEMRAILDLHQPARPNLVPPAWAVAAALGLTLAMQAAALFVQRRANRRPRRLRPDASGAAPPESYPA
jgi:YtkA-like protein